MHSLKQILFPHLPKTFYFKNLSFISLKYSILTSLLSNLITINEQIQNYLIGKAK